MYLAHGMTQKTSLENIKLRTYSWTKKDLEKLMVLLNQAYNEINHKFVTKVGNIFPDVTLTNEETDAAFQKKSKEHISYFKKFPTYVKDKLNKQLGKFENSAHLPLANHLALGENMARRHANFIARDQLAKLTQSINSAHAVYLGSRKYIWRTMCDDRVRPEHAAREGKKFSYSTPPAGGAPGDACNCRCEAEAILIHD